MNFFSLFLSLLVSLLVLIIKNQLFAWAVVRKSSRELEQF